LGHTQGAPIATKKIIKVGLPIKEADFTTPNLLSFNLETSVGHEKDVQDIGVHREFLKFVVTLLVMRTF